MPTVVSDTATDTAPGYPYLGKVEDFLRKGIIGRQKYSVVKSNVPKISTGEKIKLDQGDKAKVMAFDKGKGSPMFFAKYKGNVCIQVWIVVGEGTGIQISIAVKDFAPGVVQGILDHIEKVNIPRRETFVKKVSEELQRIGVSAPDTEESCGGGTAPEDETSEVVSKTTKEVTIKE